MIIILKGLVINQVDFHIVMWCLMKGNKSHSTVIPHNRKPPKIFHAILIDVLFVLFVKFSVVFSTGHFPTHDISNSHLHSTSYSFYPLLSLPLSWLFPTPFLPVYVLYKKEMIWATGINE